MKYFIVFLLVLAILLVSLNAQENNQNQNQDQNQNQNQNQNQQQDDKQKCSARLEVQKLNAVVEGLLEDWDNNLKMLTKEEEVSKQERDKIDVEKEMQDWGKRYLENQDALLKLDSHISKLNEMLEAHNQVHDQLVENLKVDDINNAEGGKELLEKFQKNWITVKEDLEADIKELNTQADEKRKELGKLVMELKKFENKVRDLQVIHQMAVGEKAAFQSLEDEHSKKFEEINTDAKAFIDKQSGCAKTCFDKPCSGETPICIPKDSAKEGEDQFECKAIPKSCEEVTCAEGFQCKMLNTDMLTHQQVQDIGGTIKSSQEKKEAKFAPICIKIEEEQMNFMARDQPLMNQEQSKDQTKKEDTKKEDTKKEDITKDTKQEDVKQDEKKEDSNALKDKMKNDIVDKEPIPQEQGKEDASELLAELFGSW